MKLWKILRKGLLAVCMTTLAVSGVHVSAEAAEPYETTYKVIIYSGDKGTFNGTGCVSVSGSGSAVLQGNDTIVVSGLHYNDTVSIQVSSTNGTINLNPKDGGKYQPTGTRRSGRDNSEFFDQENATSPSRTYTVTADRTFVVTYSVPGNMVPYTVSYVLAGTTTPVPGSTPETFYGAAGEKPVVSAPYFEGYQPVYRAITGTLVKGQENANWVFEYTPVTSPENTQTGTETPGQAPGAGGAAAGTQTGDNAGTQEGTGDTTGDNGENTDEQDLTAVEDTETPTDLLDLDEGEVPKSNLDLEDENEEDAEAAAEKKRFPAFIGIGATAVVLLCMLVAVYIKKEKSRK